jgi:hypothetical protein
MESTRQRLVCFGLVLLTLVSPAPVAQTDESPVPAESESGQTTMANAIMKPRYDEYVSALARARTWLDGLSIDAADLTRHRVKGKKKLAEILEAYWILSSRGVDDADQAAIVARVRQLLEQTTKPGYHNIIVASPGELNGASMTYLQIPWIMEQFGQDNGAYLDEVRKARPRLDRHVAQVNTNDHLFRPFWGPWQLSWFARFYERYGLEKPGVLQTANIHQGVIGRKVPLVALGPVGASELTHEILVAFDWGRADTQDLFDAQDLAYIREGLDYITRGSIEVKDAEGVAAGVSSLSYLDWRDDPAWQIGIDFLLDNQNKNGSWGNYELSRPEWGEYLDAHAYLHTTMVSIRALVAGIERD